MFRKRYIRYMDKHNTTTITRTKKTDAQGRRSFKSGSQSIKTTAAATWTVFTNGIEIGEFTGKTYRHGTPAADGKTYSVNGTWKAVAEKMTRYINDPEFPVA